MCVCAKILQTIFLQIYIPPFHQQQKLNQKFSITQLDYQLYNQQENQLIEPKRPPFFFTELCTTANRIKKFVFKTELKNL